MPTTAATRLRSAGLDVVVLEARDRVGGRTVNREISGTGGEVIETGDQWIGPTRHRAVSPVAELGFDLCGTYNEGKHTVEFNGKLNRSTPAHSVAGSADAGRYRADPAQTRRRRQRAVRDAAAARRVDTDAPWETRTATRLDRETFAH